MDTVEEKRKKLFEELPEVFIYYYRKKEYKKAYDTYKEAHRLSSELGMSEAENAELFGSRQDPENIISGIFSEKIVSDCFLYGYIKTGKSQRNRRYRGIRRG